MVEGYRGEQVVGEGRGRAGVVRGMKALRTAEIGEGCRSLVGRGNIEKGREEEDCGKWRGRWMEKEGLVVGDV